MGGGNLRRVYAGRCCPGLAAGQPAYGSHKKYSGAVYYIGHSFSGKHACKAVSIRTARAILKHLPLGYKKGDVIQVTRYRKITVIDENPVERKITENGTERTVWEQKFTQSGSIRIYGQEHCFSGRCRIVWNYLPTYENILDSPMLEEENQENEREKTAVFDQRPLSAERE